MWKELAAVILSRRVESPRRRPHGPPRGGLTHQHPQEVWNRDEPSASRLTFKVRVDQPGRYKIVIEFNAAGEHHRAELISKADD